MTKFKDFISSSKTDADELLIKYFLSVNTKTAIEDTYSAMKYMVFLGDGGKRIRPSLTFAACELLGGSKEKSYKYAVAIELIHSYTLILDDIQDKDSLRRGMESCHIKFGFDTAILAGMQLFEKGLRPFHALTGSNAALFESFIDKLHMGQAADLNSEKWDEENNTIENLQFIHEGKTSSLFQIALLGGAIAANADKKNINNIINYGYFLGLAFQARDDVLSIISSNNKIGKPAGLEADGNKLTYPNLYGGALEAQAEAEQLANKATEYLKDYGARAKILTDLAKYSVQREK